MPKNDIGAHVSRSTRARECSLVGMGKKVTHLYRGREGEDFLGQTLGGDLTIRL